MWFITSIFEENLNFIMFLLQTYIFFTNSKTFVQKSNKKKQTKKIQL